MGRTYETKDSGHRREFDSGARRDRASGKGRYDLLGAVAVRRLAQLLERGAEKYGDRNWEKGMPLSTYLDCATRHLFQLIDRQDDEDHAAAVLFNVMAYIETDHKIKVGALPGSLDDLPPVGLNGEKHRLENSGEKNLTPETKMPTIRCTECGYHGHWKFVGDHPETDQIKAFRCLMCGKTEVI